MFVDEEERDGTRERGKDEGQDEAAPMEGAGADERLLTDILILEPGIAGRHGCAVFWVVRGQIVAKRQPGQSR